MQSRNLFRSAPPRFGIEWKFCPKLPKVVVYFDPLPQDSEQNGNFGDILLETSCLREKAEEAAGCRID